MIDKLLLRLRARHRVSDEEEAALRTAIGPVRDVPADAVVVREGEPLKVSTVLIEGIMCRYKDLSEGSRQISELHVAGDFIDLHSYTLKTLDHGIMALSPSRIATVPHERITAMVREFPHLGFVFWFHTTLDAAILREWGVSLGRRTALGRVAHLLAELRERLAIVGMTDGDDYHLPLTQGDLAECVGLTHIHVNRMLRTLREEGIATVQDRRVRIHRRDRLWQVAEFNPDYLYLPGR